MEVKSDWFTIREDSEVACFQYVAEIFRGLVGISYTFLQYGT
jgi:hypothetical protein